MHLLQLLSLLADGDDTATDAVIDVVSLVMNIVYPIIYIDYIESG